MGAGSISAATREPTAAALLLAGTEQLAAAGIDTPRLDAEILLAEALQAPRSRLYAHLTEPLAPSVAATYDGLLQRRRRREPVAYIVGRREFWSLWLAVNGETLIPRPETEILVQAALEAVAGLRYPRILDVGTGSGCVAIAIAHERRDAEITAIDVSPPALTVARANAARHGVENRITFLHLDWAHARPEAAFDLLVANPPYVPSPEVGALEPEVSAWEPRGALDGGPDGLGLVRLLLGRAPLFLRAGGSMLVEIGSGQAAAVRGLARASGYEKVRLHPDYAGCPRVVAVQVNGAQTP